MQCMTQFLLMNNRYKVLIYHNVIFVLISGTCNKVARGWCQNVAISICFIVKYSRNHESRCMRTVCE